jgi:hypothetical protein
MIIGSRTPPGAHQLSLSSRWSKGAIYDPG